jgi:hypothetical protein
MQNVVQPIVHVESLEINRKVMPDKRERDHWWAFIAGRPESDWNPPKVPKQRTPAQTRRRYGQGLRGFSDDLDYDTAGTRTPQETWHINDEGEVELALRIDPTESLPTPSGSPAPPILDSGQSGPLTSLRTPGGGQEPLAYKPREPTPTLLNLIDHVRLQRLKTVR